MARKPDITRTNAGVALFLALALLFLFSLLGTAYLRYAMLDRDAAVKELAQARARMAAQAGVHAAVGRMAAALKANTSPQDAFTVAVPSYVSGKDPSAGVVADDRRESRVAVTVTDECAKVNLNHAPTRILEALLGVNASAARAIRAGLPRMPGESDQPNAQGAWLTSLDDLVARKLIDQSVYEKVDRNLVTVYTVSNPLAPARYINLNTASPEVLSAVLNISKPAAAAVAAKRPFRTLADVAAATGTDPATFNIAPDPATPEELPAAFTFQSRCYRIVSEAELGAKSGGRKEAAGGKSRIEAVVLFHDNGVPEIRYWQEGGAAMSAAQTSQDGA